MTRLIKDWLRDEYGASAAELALVMTPLMLLLFGIIHLCLLAYSAMQLNYAAEATARCVVTSATSAYASSPCYTSALATSYFTNLYRGATASPTLTLCGGAFSNCSTSTYGCNNTNYQVVATANYVIQAVFLNKTVGLTAKACFPHT